MAGPCSSEHGPVPFTVLKNFLVWIIYGHLKPFKFMAGPRSPTSPITAQLISQRWKVFSSWCHADCQKRSIQRLVVLPETRSSSFDRVETSSRLDGMKLFKNHHFYNWAVLSQTRPKSFHGVEKPSRLDVMQPFKTIQVCIKGRAPHHLMSRSSSFRGVEKSFRLMEIVNNVQMNGWWCSSKHDRIHFTMLKHFLVWLVLSFAKTLDFMAGPCPQSTAQNFHFSKKLFDPDVMVHTKNFQVFGRAALPNIPCHSPAGFAGLKIFRFVRTQTFNNVQMNG